MKYFIYVIIAVPILICIAFFFMGRSSASGSPAGLIDGRLAPLPNKPNAVSSEMGTSDDKAVAPISATLNQVIAAIEQTGGTITSQKADYVSAVYSSNIFKFIDDVELRQEGDLVHIRSASRVGYSDRGVNKKRVESIRSAIKPQS